jgi:pyocin large subunit-like protein
MTVIANQSRGNLTCSTSGFNIHINLNKGNTVNVFSSQGVASSTFDPSAGDYLKVLNMKLGMADAWFATEEQCF